MFSKLVLASVAVGFAREMSRSLVSRFIFIYILPKTIFEALNPTRVRTLRRTESTRGVLVLYTFSR